MQLDHEGLADPTCVVFGYLLPRDQAALRSTSRTFVRRFNRAVWYGCGIPYAGCQTVFKTLEEAEEATETGCRWAPIALLRDDHQQRHDIEGGTLLMDISYGAATCSLEANHGCQLLCDRSAAKLMRFKSVIVLPSTTASSIRSLKLLESTIETVYLQSLTQWIDLRAFDHVEELLNGSLTNGRVSSLNFTDQLPKMVSIGDNVAYSSSLVREVHLCNHRSLETIGSAVFYHSANIEKVVLEDLPRLKTVGEQFCALCGSLKVFSAKNIPVLKEVGGEMLGGCVALESVSFVDCPTLSVIGDKFLQGSGGSCMVVDLSGLAALSIAPAYMISQSDVVKLRFIASPNMQEVKKAFLLECRQLKEVEFVNTESITSFAYLTMAGCSSIESISLEAFPSLTSVGSAWLSYCRSLQRLDLSPLKKLERIGDEAFMECNTLTECSLKGLSKLSSIGAKFLHGTFLCTLNVCGCTALASIGVMEDDKRQRGLKAIEGANDLPPQLRAVLEETVVRRSCTAM